MGKRGQNEGTIRKRKDGRWEARAIIGRTIDGKPKFKYIYKKRKSKGVPLLFLICDHIFSA